MVPVLCLDIEPHHAVLDMCASPGSKTSQVGTGSHCGVSGMFIPDRNFFHPGSRIRIIEFKYFIQKNCLGGQKVTGSRIRIRYIVGN
jgi:hypothetical protein